jgi:hypothetical protein
MSWPAGLGCCGRCRQPTITSPTALVAWLTDPCAHLDGRSRAQALANGYDVRRLVAEAPAFGMPQ